MYGSDRGSRRLRKDWIAFAILFVIISSLLCTFVHIPVPLYFALLFVSGLIAYIISTTLLRWFENRRTAPYGKKTSAYRHW